MELEVRSPHPSISTFRRLAFAMLALVGLAPPHVARAQSEATRSDPTATAIAAEDSPWSVEHFTRPEEDPPWEERARADELTREAQQAAEDDDCAAAIPLFAEAYRIRGKKTALLGAVKCAASERRWQDASALVAHLIENHGRSAATSTVLEEIASHTGSIAVSATPADATVEIEGASLDDPPQRLAPGKYAIRVSRQGFYPVQQIVELAAGAEEVVTITLKRAPPEGATAHFDQKQVIDFCRLASGAATDVQKLQRLVLFAVGGAEVTNEPESELDARGQVVSGVEHRVFEDARAHDHLREVFASTFPSDHFYTVQTRAAGPVALAGKSSVSNAEMIRAASVDPFAGYSIACADWVAIPRVAKKKAGWRKVEKQRQVGGKTANYEAWTVDVTYELEVDVYRREARTWALVTTLEGSSRDEPRAEAPPPVPVDPGAKRQADTLLVSQAPHPACEVLLPGSAAQMADGFRSCGEALWPVQERAAEVLASHADAPRAEPDPERDPRASLEDESVSTAPPADDAEPSEATALSASEVACLERVAGPDPTGGLPDITRGALTGGTAADLAAVAEAATIATSKCQEAVNAVASTSAELDAAPSLGEDDQPEAALGFAACGGLPVRFVPGKPVPADMKQSQSPFCTNLKDDVNLGEAGMRSAAVCGVRVAAERAALKLRSDARRLEGWKSFDALQQRPTGKKRGFGFALGEAEGHRRGDLFVVEVPSPDGTMDRIGFGRIVEVGPGGEASTTHPSHFKFRTGTVQPEARLREWKQIGVRVGPHARYSFRYVKGDLDAAFPGGVGITVAYDGTSFVQLGDEFWFRLDVGYLIGAAEFGYGDVSVYADLLPEVHFYGSDRLAWVITAGVGGSQLRGTYVEANPAGGEATAAVRGLGAAAILGGGLDAALHPDWNLQGLLKVRQGLHPFAPKGELNGETVHLDASVLGAIELALTATYTF